MRLQSVTLRQYRIHRALKVALDGARTLIGGPNESGKSTLVEAIHRAFFVKAKGTTEYHRAMVSTIHEGHPEVEVEFEAGGVSYLLKKRFGASGTVTLISGAATALSGDAAESELTRLLGVESGVTGKAVLAQWSHLWIWQGSSGGDPVDHAGAQHGNLLRRLQDSGGAAAMQSDLDSQVSASFAATTESIYTQAGKARTGSELEKAETAATLAEVTRQYAAARLEKGWQLVRDFEEATQSLDRAGHDLATLTKQKLEVETQLARVDELRAQHEAQAVAAQALADRHATRAKAHRQILKLAAQEQALAEALTPKNLETASRTEARGAARQRADEMAVAYENTCDRTRALRQRRDLAVAVQSRLEKAARRDDLAAKIKQANASSDALALLRPELARLPEIDAPQLERLHRLGCEQNAAETRLQAMAAGLEILAADTPVIVAGEPLTTGQMRIITEDTEVSCGPSLRLQIRPGGGTSLEEAKRKEHDARQTVRKMLDALCVPTAAAASDVVARREEIARKIGQAEAELRALDAAGLATALADADHAHTAAEAEVARRSEAVSGFTAPAALPDAKRAVGEEERQLRASEADEAQARQVRDLAAEAFQHADEALTAHQTAILRQTGEIAELRAQVRLLLETHGEDGARAAALEETSLNLTAAGERLARTQQALAQLQPELLASDFTRLRKALEHVEAEQRAAELKRAVAQAGLRSDGADDPEAALAMATAQARSAQEHLAGVRRKAEALRLLNRLFLDEQRALADRFTRPLADRISGYLECLFGPGVRAEVTLEEKAFGGLRIVRPAQAGGAVSFAALSGGAREQVAAAVRLAMAEVLCHDHHGCLPVLFDDAFAYSDPDRVQTLQRMLYLAAERGLQVIVLTCNPSDYTALPAARVTLSTALSSPADPAPPLPFACTSTARTHPASL